jgi:hypothetical protein
VTDPDWQRPRLLEIPIVWFAILVVECVVLAAALRALVPEDLGGVVVVAIWVGAFVLLAGFNVALRRRFVPR